jgi:RHH-type proline utilization regulon transcriptional repressor/proline dehydrogenase/delta 1-pyrroline-5-carboxylate dehydrogenase
MCLAEALLRIPDGEPPTGSSPTRFRAEPGMSTSGDSESMLVNASTWGFMLTGRVVALDRNDVGEARSWYRAPGRQTGRARGARGAQAGHAHSSGTSS